MIYHVLNRANTRMTIFKKDEDYAAFEVVLQEACLLYTSDAADE